MNSTKFKQRKNKLKYLKNTKASPATNLLEVTNVLHPVVSKCLLGWPMTKFNNQKRATIISRQSNMATSYCSLGVFIQVIHSLS